MLEANARACSSSRVQVPSDVKNSCAGFRMRIFISSKDTAHWGKFEKNVGVGQFEIILIPVRGWAAS